jgi:hypothetical protein
MKNTSLIALIFGVASVACSSVVWIALLLRHLPRPIYWNLSAGTSLLLWGTAVALAGLAAWLGSKRWAWAALLPVGSVLLFFALVKLLEPTGH